MMHPAAARAEFILQVRRGIGLDEALGLQREALARLREDRAAPGLLLAAEHAPVVTMGRAGSPDHLRHPPDELARRGIAYREVRRGGDVTYHGPGQAVLYPVFPLERWRRDLHAYMRLLEEAILRYLAGRRIEGRRIPGLTGVWAGEEKIAALGIAVNHWIAWHGIAVNVQPCMAHFDTIVPCGIADRGVTSLERLTGMRYDMDAELRRLAEAFLECLGATAREPEEAPHGEI